METGPAWAHCQGREETTREAVRGRHVCVCGVCVSPVEMSALRRVLCAQEVPAKATRLVIDQHMVWDDLTPLQGRTAVYHPLAVKCSGIWATVGFFSEIWMQHKEFALCKQNLDAS